MSALVYVQGSGYIYMCNSGYSFIFHSKKILGTALSFTVQSVYKTFYLYLPFDLQVQFVTHRAHQELCDNTSATS